MRRINILFIIFFVWGLSGFAQEFDITISGTDNTSKTYQARNSITFSANYTFTANGSTLTANIVNPIVDGSVAYNTVVNPMNRSLITTYLVGSTNGAFNVSALGGGSYTIPLDLPAGVAGLQPNLAIAYNSMAGAGVAGYGWNISGLSAITRSPQNFYNDNTSVGVNLTASDRFSLDGQRLVYTGTYGANNSEYRTENDQFIKITCLTDGTSSPKRFLAKTKGGMTIEYGYEGDSDQTIDGLTEEVSWYIDKMTDVYGNTIEYEYIKQFGHNYIGEITYGPNTVTFYYKERTDKETSYFIGGTLQQNLILDKVEIKYNSSVIKKYELKYNYNSANYGGASVLNEVIEYGINNSRYNSTVFFYEYPTGNCSNYPSWEYNSYISTDYTQYPGDFNGDGRTDVFTVKKSNLKDWRLYLANSYGGLTYSASGTNTYDISSATLVDLNGDNCDDLIIKRYVGVSIDIYGNLSDLYSYYYALNTGNTFSSPVFFINAHYDLINISGAQVVDANMADGMNDMDGDGLADILVVSQTGWRIFGYSFSGNTLTGWGQKYSGSGLNVGNKYQMGDVNGDGKSEVWTFDSNGIKIYALSGSAIQTIYTNSYPNKDHLFKLGDFNGDGKTDIFVYGSGTYEWSEWQFRLSTGTDFIANYFTKKKTDLKSDVVYTGDFNGDGRTDIMALSKNTSNNPRQYYFVTKPNATDVNSEYYDRTEYNKDYQFTLGDYDGNGKTDILVTAASNGYRRGKMDGNTNILLSRFADGLNYTGALTYRKLSGEYSNYEKGTTITNFPVYTYTGPLNVVVEYWVNGGTPVNQDYSYKGLKIHRQGKGALGYEQIIVEDTNQGIKTETNSSYNTSYFYPTVNSVITKSGTNLMSTVTNSWSHLVLNSAEKRILPYIDSTKQTDNLTGLNVSQKFIYSIEGNLTQTIKNYYNGVTEKVDNLYDGTTTYNWIGGRLSSSTVTYAKTGETSIVRKTSFTYSTDGKLKPDFIKYLENTGMYSYKNYDYNTNGNVTQVYNSSTNGGVRQTNYTYETDKIRVKTVTDPLGHVTTNNYNPNGQLISQVDYLTNTTSYAYDNMGRTQTETASSGFIASTAYVWGVGTFTNSCFYVQQSGNDGSLAKTWYDKMGREIRTDVKAFNGSTIYTNSEYNTKGQLYRVSEPSISATASQWNTNSYDSYGRIIGIARPSNNNTSYVYEPNSSKVYETTAGQSGWKVTNSMGLVTTAHDNGGDIIYTYYPDGAIKTISPAGGGLTSIEYDEAGYQKKLVDPSAGTIQYSYNVYGQLKSQTNGRLQTTGYDYLPDGRLDKITSPEGQTTYSYNSNKQLTGISSPGSVSHGFAYDVKGRVQTISENISGSNFSTTFTYDLGRIKTRTHPSGIVETNNYNTNGYLASISAGGATRYTTTAMNERQQITTATYGSNLNATFGYDSYGYPTSSKAGTIKDYRYYYNPVTGNPKYRQNYLLNKREDFRYDNLNRLDSVTGPQNLLMAYAANGNMTAKNPGGISLYKYDNSAKPYQLTDIETPVTSPQLVSDVQQDIVYTSFEQPATITEVPYLATFAYNSDGQRAKMEVKQNGNTQLTRFYVGSSYIKDVLPTGTKEYTWIGGDAYTAIAIAYKNGSTTNWYSILRDPLGNITHLVWPTNNVVGEYSFDAWGRRRDKDTWSYTITGDPELLADRGFTGHEFLPWFNLYNMNGRLYDPIVGRFISPDNNVQMTEYTQNFNRYSYVLNNPLKYTDPDGEFWHIIIGAAIGGTINLATNWNNCNGFWEFAAAFGSGAGSGALTAAFGPLGALGGGALVGGTNDLISQTGNNFSGSVNWGQVSISTGVGGVAGIAGYGAGQWASSNLGGVVINGININNQSVWANTINGAIGGATGGYAGGFTGGLLTTGNLNKAHQAGMSGMITGASIGGVAGGIGGYAYAKSNDINPWTGKYNKSIVIGRQMESRVNPVAGDLGAETITNAWNEQFGEGVRVSDSKGIQFNRRWYSGKLQDGYHAYDIGSGGLPSGKYYGAELSLSKGYWNISKAYYWSYFNNNIRIIYYGK